jgi:hypothetical protein
MADSRWRLDSVLLGKKEFVYGYVIDIIFKMADGLVRLRGRSSSTWRRRVLPLHAVRFHF